MQLHFYFDQSRCIGCQTCVVSCKDWNDVPAGKVAWLRKKTVERGEFPRVSVTFLHFTCFHCAQPPCIPACPTSALDKREKDGIVVIHPDRCLPNCQACLRACPYQAPQFPEGDAPMEKCHFCLERIEAGHHPVCVDSCPQRALDYGAKETLLFKYPLAVPWVEGDPDPAAAQPSFLMKKSTR
ncbi:MAG: 4Fe-4S dicluster domain-containing protein [Deltaproteobacteria bacterium]|nr:4Fe-4S dicluster domain-containing protein [Deltaproteobacteria bacterium]